MAFSKFYHAKISGVVTVLPENVIHIDDELCFYENDPQKLARNKKILGLGDRYTLPQGLTCLDLCEEAAKHLIKKMHINKDEIDCIITVSETHDYAIPGDSCLIQGKLGIPEECLCFDVSGLSCSGYVHGLLMAHSLIESGVAKKCLLLAGDMNGSRSDIRNRNSAMLYSDAGSATVVEYCKDTNESCFYVGTRGKEWDKIIVPASGNRLPIRNDITDIEIKDSKNNIWRLWDVILKGFDVFQFTMDVAPKSINKLLEYSGKKIKDIDYFSIHQANGQIVKTIAQHAKLPKDKVSGQTFEKYANCGAASIVSVLCDQVKDKKVKNTMLVTFGVGLSWATCIIDFSNVINLGVQFLKTPDKIISREDLIQKWIKYFKDEK